MKILRRELTKTDYLFISGFVILHLALSLWKFDYTMDDAYISMRYSKHLAEGSGLVWNLGGAPVEGYTSTLWVLFGAIPHLLGIDPILFMKSLTLISAIVVVVGLYIYGTSLGVSKIFLLPTVAIIGLSPPVAYNSTLGMESILAMLFVFISSICVIELNREYNRAIAAILGIFLTLSMFTRPGLVLFGGGAVVGTLVMLFYYGEYDNLLDFTKVILTLVFLPGLIFMVSRFLYFGQWLPNPFHVKSSEAIISLAGAKGVILFGLDVVGPLIFVIATYILFSKYGDERELLSLLPLILGTSLFLVLWVFVEPIQNELWRFQLPILSAIAVSFIQATRESTPLVTPEADGLQIGISIVVVILLVTFPLNTIPDAAAVDRFGTPEDRIHVGQSLNSHADEDYKMFITEAGALPYYSEWYAVDDIGLNNQTIAENGLSTEFISEYDPDLISLIGYWEEGALSNERPTSAQFLNESDEYVLVAVIERTESDAGRVLYYFVDSESEGYQEIACSLLTVDEVEYKNTTEYEEMAKIDIMTAEMNSSDCG